VIEACSLDAYKRFAWLLKKAIASTSTSITSGPPGAERRERLVADLDSPFRQPYHLPPHFLALETGLQSVGA